MSISTSNETASFSKLTRRLIITAVFSIAFAYIEAAVVVYLRTIFHPSGFTFPLITFGTTAIWQRHLLIEIGRESATMVLILTAAYLFGRNQRQRFAYFLVIFSIWDIFYYVWLKVLINWPASIWDWDVLFLIPVPWASAVLAPILISITLLSFAIIILYHDRTGKVIKITPLDWFGFCIAGAVVITSFCTAGLHITQPDYNTYFSWPLFTGGLLTAIIFFTKKMLKSN
jgi:hypothetical protein